MPNLGYLASLDVGFAFKSADFTQSKSDVRLLRGVNIAPGRVDWSKVQHFPEQMSANYEKYFLRDGDVLLAMDRPWIESGLKFAVVRSSDLPALLVQRVARLRAKQGIDQGYIAALIASTRFKDYIRSVTTGSAVPHISGSQINSFPVEDVPPLDEQRRIAATLGALDGKIESNRRQVSLLQETAMGIFRRWRAQAGTGSITSFGEYADVFGGATPKTSIHEYWGGELAWTTPTDVTGLSSPYLFFTGRTITRSGLDSCTAVMHPPGTIFMTSRATIGAFAVNQVEASTNQGFIAVRPRKDYQRWFLFEEMRSRVNDFLDNANGSTFLEISRGRFKELELLAPPESQIEALNQQLAELHKLSTAREKEAAALEALRDALLPELLLGRIRTTEVENTVEEAVS